MGDKSETKGKNNERDDLMRAIFRLEVKKKTGDRETPRSPQR